MSTFSISVSTASLSAQNSLKSVNDDFSKSANRLSSGDAIQSAGDNPAGIATITKFDANSNTLAVVEDLISDGQNVLQTADGGLEQVAGLLIRIKELSTKGNTSIADFTDLNAELQQLTAELDRVSTSVSFSGVNLLDGTFVSSFQVGLSASDTISIDLSSGDVSSTALGLSAALTSQASAATLGGQVDSAINTIATLRATVGSYISRLTHASSLVGVSKVNVDASLSSVKDVDYAAESSSLSSDQLKMQSTINVISTSNDLGNALLTLTRT